jgi:hypothetical protein
LEIEKVKPKCNLCNFALLTRRAYKRLLGGSDRKASPRQNALNHKRSRVTKVIMPLMKRDSFSDEGSRRTTQ